MEPLDIAGQLASIHNKCRNNKCPFASSCDPRKSHSDCGMYELALLIRSEEHRIRTLEAMVDSLRSMVVSLNKYAADLEKVNGKYRKLAESYRNLDHPRKYKRGKTPPRQLKPKEDPLEMDGDPRYAPPPERINYDKLVVI